MRKGIAACLMAIITVGIALEMRTTTEQMGEKAEFAVVKMGSMTETTLLSGKVGYIDNQPCVAMRNGIISKVHVKAGQEVEKGDLLFTLETAQEERALADVFEKMYFQQNQSGQFGEVAQVFNMSAQSSTGDLMLSVESSRIRASADGVVENVYVEAGSEVSTSQLLGNVHGNEIGLVVETKDYTKFTPGMRASAQIQGETLPLVLKSISVSNPLQASATLCFSAEGVVFPEELLNRKIAVEVFVKEDGWNALVPLEAFDAEEKIWLIRDGRMYSSEPEVVKMNREYAALDSGFAGSVVLLHPENHAPEEGKLIRGL